MKSKDEELNSEPQKLCSFSHLHWANKTVNLVPAIAFFAESPYIYRVKVLK